MPYDCGVGQMLMQYVDLKNPNHLLRRSSSLLLRYLNMEYF